MEKKGVKRTIVGIDWIRPMGIQSGPKLWKLLIQPHGWERQYNYGFLWKVPEILNEPIFQDGKFYQYPSIMNCSSSFSRNLDGHVNLNPLCSGEINPKMMDLPQQFVVKVHPMDGLSSCLLFFYGPDIPYITWPSSPKMSWPSLEVTRSQIPKWGVQ
jgi:hypothetical protein